MIEVPGYHVSELVHENHSSRIYRGYREHDALPVILKVPAEDLPSTDKLHRLQKEYELMRTLHLDGVAAAYGLELHQARPVLVLEDPGGASLDKLGIAGKLPLAEWLRLALGITRCVAQLHGQRVIHRDINPSNIVWNRQTGQVKLIDLELATESTAFSSPGLQDRQALQGTLAYLSPEQTGRMNRPLDYRTDFYSLGVTFYELLTGQLPFRSDDPMELVHAHIAVSPPTAEQVDPRVPPAASAIVAKLMAKTAEERYQSAEGLLADLQTCRDTLDEGGHIPAFELGRRDFSNRLQVSRKLYGRSEETAALLAAFDRVCGGRPELFLVAGYSGVGKSAVVHAAQKHMAARHASFIEGKFDQFKRDVPYSGLIQAFSQFVQQLLTKDDTVIRQWRDRLLQALDSNGQVIVDIIPNVELVIGPQAAVSALPPEQAQNRFNRVFHNFVAAFASADHPLVIFLDDLQWSDLPSLQLMSLLLRDSTSLHLLLIGAYRDNEVPASHPLMMILKEMEKTGIALRTLLVPPLGRENVTPLLCDTFQADAADVADLADLCFAKTQGNPFFLTQFLQALNERGAVRRDMASGRWSWDAESIRQAGITDNVVDLMIGRLRMLPGPTQDVIQGAACLGNVFEREMLSVVCGLEEDETERRLWPALDEGLVVPLGSGGRGASPGPRGDAAPPKRAYRFLHDRVQQAAYLLSDESGKPARHLAIGRLWLRLYSRGAEQQDMLFDMVNHLNLGRALITDGEERFQLARLNAAAAHRAKASAAYEAAREHLQTALELVADEDWGRQHGFMLSLHLAAAEVARLVHDWHGMERHVSVALSRSTNVLDRAKAHEIRIEADISRDRSLDAVMRAIQLLRLLGNGLPENPGRRHIVAGLLKTKLALVGKTMDDLARLPEVTDPRIAATLSNLARIGPPSLATMPMLTPLLLFSAVPLMVRYGFHQTTPPFFAAFAMVLCGVLGDVEQGARFGELALRLQQRLPAGHFEVCRAKVIVHGTVHPWHKPLRETLEPLRQDYLASLDTGDTEYVANAAQFHCFHAFYAGQDLGTTGKDTARYGEALDKMQRASHHNALKSLWQAILILQGAPQPGATHIEALPSESDANDLYLLFQRSCVKLVLSFLFRDHRAALEEAERGAVYAKNKEAFFGSSIVCFYGSLARLALLPEADQGERARLLRQVKKDQKKMRRWAAHAPGNFLHKWFLVEAELARRTGRAAHAVDCYENAARLAGENHFVHEQALAHELAGESSLERGQAFLARAHLVEAQRGYLRWGASAKARELTDRYPDWLKTHESSRHRFASGSKTESLTGAASSGMLDEATIMKASQALSREIILERLFKRLLDLVVENAGAQRGLLLLLEENQWRLEAEKTDSEAETQVLQGRTLGHEAQEVMPSSLLQYVQRTRQHLVIHEAMEEPLVADDGYVQHHRPRSVLAMPILLHGELIGLLYLENNAVSGAFTQERLKVLHLLASQTAISIQNARLYAEMEERVAARTAELSEKNQTLESEIRERQKVEADLRKAREDLVAAAHQAGKAEIATNVLHNVGNVLNSVNTSASLIHRKLQALRIAELPMLAQLIDSHKEDLGAFITTDERGKLIPAYLGKLSKALVQERDDISGEALQLARHVDNINHIVASQQEYAGKSSVTQQLAIGDLIDESLQAQAEPLERYRIEVTKETAPMPALPLDKARVSQILSHLVSNAIQAMENQPQGARRLVLRTESNGDMLRISVQDSGEGISPENLTRIFAHGFTTWKDRHGFGLHSCINAANEMGGALIARSDGPGQGSVFTLEIPVLQPTPNRP